MFNNTWLYRYPRLHKVVFDNGSNFKRDFTPLLKEFSIAPICKYIKNTKSRLVPDYTVRLIHNWPLFGTQGSLTFYFDIDPYIITLFLFFSILYSTCLTTYWDMLGALPSPPIAR